MGRRWQRKMEEARHSPLAAHPTNPRRWRERVQALRSVRVDLALGVLIPLLAFLAYLPAIHGGYIWDDDVHIVWNPTLRSLAGLGQIWFVPTATPQYYPLVHTTFWLEYHLWGLDPHGYHAVNVGLHALSALVLWRLLVRLEVPAAWFAAAVFALHPVHVESVAWATERKNVLSGLLYLCALAVYLRFALPREDEPRGRRAWKWYVAGFVLFVGA